MARSCVYRQNSRSIPTKDSHALWGNSAGRCAFPTCTIKCIDSPNKTGTVLIGEMAHVLAHAKKGPRAMNSPNNSVDRYENLILLCPNHHTLVDKAPKDYPAELLRQWKAALENRVANALDLPVFATKAELYKYVEHLLAENKFIHNQFGPMSETANRNPVSNIQMLWEVRKIEQIIPNNALILAAFKRFYNLVPADDLGIFEKFQAHAIAFAASAEERLDSSPLFPIEFEHMISKKED